MCSGFQAHHERRYARTSEWLDVLDASGQQDHFSFSGNYYKVDGSLMQRAGSGYFPQSAALQGKVRGGRMPIARTPKACPAPRPGPLLG